APNKPCQTWDRSPLLFRAALPPAAYSPIVRSHEYASREQPRNNNWPAHSGAGRAQTARAFLHCTAALQARPSRLGLAYRRMNEEAKAEQAVRVYGEMQKAETAALEKERRELRQFLIILKDQRPAT